jgi:hypothetical protein
MIEHVGLSIIEMRCDFSFHFFVGFSSGKGSKDVFPCVSRVTNAIIRVDWEREFFFRLLLPYESMLLREHVQKISFGSF